MKRVGFVVTCVVVFVLLTVAAGFYLFVAPVLVATDPSTSGFGVGFALFLYAQLWLLSAVWAFESMARLYRWPTPNVLARVLR